jgi:hypothetical protein
MAEQEKKIYCGSGRKIKDYVRAVSICLDDYPQEFINEYKGKKYIKLNVVDKKEKDQYGKDIYVTVDTWKPEPKGEPLEESHADNSEEDEDLPF